LRQKSMPLDLVQKFLGHSRIETTQIYSEAPDDVMKTIYRNALS
jgi:site-specific recombinase XerD